MKKYSIILLFFAAFLRPVSAQPMRPVCPTYYDLGYEVSISRAEVIAPGRAWIRITATAPVALIVIDVVGREGRLYGMPIAYTDWPGGLPLDMHIDVPPEAGDYNGGAGILVRTWRNSDQVGNPVCRQAVLLPGARLYVPLVAR